MAEATFFHDGMSMVSTRFCDVGPKGVLPPATVLRYHSSALAILSQCV